MLTKKRKKRVLEKFIFQFKVNEKKFAIYLNKDVILSIIIAIIG